MIQTKGNPIFPLRIEPTSSDWKYAGNPSVKSKGFNSFRKPGRIHAGCDLYVPSGTEVYAVESGVVTWINPRFLNNFASIEILHDGFTVLYGEVVPIPGLKAKDPVSRGQLIARVGNQWDNSQLHFELYPNPKGSKHTVQVPSEHPVPPYNRCMTPTNPAPYLIAWKTTLSAEIEAAKKAQPLPTPALVR